MAQRSLHAITKVYYRTMSYFAMVSQQTAPLAVLKFPAQSGPFCTMWFKQFTQNVTKTNHKDRSHPQSTEHDTQPITYLIHKQDAPYRTCGGTCCPVVSTPKIQSLADSSMTNHITWRDPTISTIPTLLKPHHRSSPWSNDISTDGRPSLTKTQARLNITKDGKTCTTLMTAWLSITNQVWTQILSMMLRYSIKACMPVCTLEKEKEHIWSIWSRVTCLLLICCCSESSPHSLESSRTMKHLNDNDRKQVIQRINKSIRNSI
jgi:hypothetical protein